LARHIAIETKGEFSMLTISTSLARCSPGKRDQFMALALEGMKLFERHGAAHVRLLSALNAGQASDVYALTNEFDSAERYGEFVDELYRDAEFESFMTRITNADSPMTVVSRTLETEVPLDRAGPAGRGVIVAAYIGKTHPGRFDDCCELVRGIFSFVEGHGASNCHLLQLDSAGPRTGELMARWECDSMRTRGKILDALTESPDGRELMTKLRDADSPVSITWGGLYRNLHM